MTDDNLVLSPDHPNLGELCNLLQAESNSLHEPASAPNWPTRQLNLTREYGVEQWFIPKELGGLGWSQRDIVEGYLQLSQACLTTAFIITQRAAAIRRIVASEHDEARRLILPAILASTATATVGISHLTTSRRHVGRPVLAAEQSGDGFRLNGYSPWVTGACGAEYIVVGAECDDQKQVLLAVPRELSGVTVDPGFALVALSASQTGAVHFDQVQVDPKWLLAGPVENVLTSGKLSATGGFQTSALALGLATAAIQYIASEAEKRSDLFESFENLNRQREMAIERLLQLASGNPVCTSEALRTEANSLVLRATQAALVAAKGAGFISGHPVGRWCREAMFFLVWSCPQPVATANLCEFAGIE